MRTFIQFLQAAGVRLRTIVTCVQTWAWRQKPKPAEVFYFRPGNIVPVTGRAKLIEGSRAWVVTESGSAAWVPVSELFRRAA